MSETPYIHEWHYDMLIDHERNEFYRDLIRNHCRGKVVLEIGTGAGLLAALAVKYGAEKVICCEENPYLADVAEKLFARLKITDNVQLIRKNSNHIATDEIPAVDVILHELFGSDPFEEFMIPTLKDARRFLKPGGVFLPDKIQLLCRPVKNQDLPQKVEFDGIELSEVTALLSEIHPRLRRREVNVEVLPLPPVTVQELIEAPYTPTLKHPSLRGADAIEISFFIIDGEKKYQAAKFDEEKGRVHWFTLFYTKWDDSSDNITFVIKDDKQLQMF